MIALAARAYERAILRIGAPVKLHRLFTPLSQQPHGVPATANSAHSIKTAASKQEAPSRGQPRLSPTADVALRIAAVGLVIAGAVVGFGQQTAIALVAIGLLLLIIEQTLKHHPRRPAH